MNKTVIKNLTVWVREKLIAYRKKLAEDAVKTNEEIIEKYK